MQSWSSPESIHIPGVPLPLALYDTADDAIKEVQVPMDGSPVGMYVCGITPYDSTHLGHAATYVTFDLISRQLQDNGHHVHFVENVTDVDEPLFERAHRDHVDWQELGDEQINLFRSDMQALSVFPPEHYIGAMEAVPDVIAMVQKLIDNGAAYVLDDEYADIYMDHTFTPQFGYESRYSEAEMLKLFSERGGDPDRNGKRHPLDPLLWQMNRPGEPSWDAPFGAGRPGWHIECAAIATKFLGPQFAIQGGGSDLRFPHHEYSAAHAEADYSVNRMAGHYVHTGMIGMDGTKMSKSLGNLEFVSQLLQQGNHPGAIRLGIYADHYRTDRDWSSEKLAHATDQLHAWSMASYLLDDSDREDLNTLIFDIRSHLSQDLDTPGALDAIDKFVESASSKGTDKLHQSKVGLDFSQMIYSLLGIKLLTEQELTKALD